MVAEMSDITQCLVPSDEQTANTLLRALGANDASIDDGQLVDALIRVFGGWHKDGTHPFHYQVVLARDVLRRAPDGFIPALLRRVARLQDEHHAARRRVVGPGVDLPRDEYDLALHDVWAAVCGVDDRKRRPED